LGYEKAVHGVVEGFQQPSSENFFYSLCPKGGNFLKNRHYKASVLTRYGMATTENFIMYPT
jgi:hypothetical protein